MDDPAPTPRKLVKARLLADLHSQLTTYATRTHRTVSSATEHLVALGLQAEGHATAGGDPVHLR